jgi:hypothetical protein
MFGLTGWGRDVRGFEVKKEFRNSSIIDLQFG